MSTLSMARHRLSWIVMSETPTKNKHHYYQHYNSLVDRWCTKQCRRPRMCYVSGLRPDGDVGRFLSWGTIVPKGFVAYKSLNCVLIKEAILVNPHCTKRAFRKNMISADKATIICMFNYYYYYYYHYYYE